MKIITGIYVIRNKRNDKVYIGSSKDIFHRMDNHRYKLKDGNNNSLHNHTILNKYELIASERRQAHLDGKLDYASYLRAYKQYKRACPLYGETF